VAQHIVSQFKDASGQVAAAKTVNTPESKPVEPQRTKEPEPQPTKTVPAASPASATSAPAKATNTIEAPAVAKQSTPNRSAFRQGVSSYTVEQLARGSGCAGHNGAELISEPGTVETYKVVCDDGGHLEALCEYRQCKVTGRFR